MLCVSGTSPRGPRSADSETTNNRRTGWGPLIKRVKSGETKT